MSNDIPISNEEIEELRRRLAEAEDTLHAIRTGDVDALVLSGPTGEQIYTLKGADDPYRHLVEQMQEGAATATADGDILYANKKFAELLKMPLQRLIGSEMAGFMTERYRGTFADLLLDAGSGEASGEVDLYAADGTVFPVRISVASLTLGNIEGVSLVISDLAQDRLRARELAETNNRLSAEIAERKRAEASLRQSQKMEAVGQLTGGIAHDFNNLLTVILGNIETLQRRLPADADEFQKLLAAVMRSADRAADLTHQLLAFSRRQQLQPKAVDANKLIAGMSELLRRTLGESIAIETVLAGTLWHSFVDPNQVENALLNLAINARDAMPQGGKLTIETANTHLDESYAAQEEVAAGHYVLLAVTDTGCGMSKAVAEQAFEPFFTTKETGRGTGLGLSQVYGFVRQSKGHVKIHSELGAGTTVKIYLPRLFHDAQGHEIKSPEEEVPGGRADVTILVVEDDADVRAYSTGILRELGYRVLDAASGAAALGMLEARTDIRLLFTDVGLPGGMNGRQLATAACRRRPLLKVLFTTGYARDAIVHEGRLDPRVELIQKPFTYAALAAKIQSVLEGAALSTRP